MEITRLLVDDLAAAGGNVENGKIRVIGQALDGLGLRVVGVEVQLPVAVGTEIDRVADPRGLGVVAARSGLRHLLDRARRDVVDPDSRDGAAAVALPLEELLGKRIVGDAPAVGGEGRAVGVGDGQALLRTSLDGHGEELRKAAGEHRARRGEEDRLAVGGEALDDVGARMPGQALRHAALGGDDVDVGIAFVLSGEGDPVAVGREGGARFDADVGGQALHVAAVRVAGPQIVGVDEGDLPGADGGFSQEPGVVNVESGRCGQRRRGTGDEKKEGQAEFHGRFSMDLVYRRCERYRESRP